MSAGPGIGRLIGENIHLQIIPGPGLGRVKTHPGQLEQIIMNLAVNARDAMPEGGELTMETANVELDEVFLLLHPAAPRGPCAVLVVTDTGIGMNEEVQQRAFDPFFTTKEVGKGAGLGLSVVYGIVKQSDGYVTVSSQPGRGAEFRIYLPRVLETPEPVVVAETAAPERGVETILVAEDEPAVRGPVCDVLRGAGYRVLAGNDVEEVIQTAGRHDGPIHLLLTDVVMPDMSGPELARHLQPTHPQMKVLYMSAFSEPRIPESPLTSDNFISKPFTKDELLRRLREALEDRKA